MAKKEYREKNIKEYVLQTGENIISSSIYDSVVYKDYRNEINRNDVTSHKNVLFTNHSNYYNDIQQLINYYEITDNPLSYFANNNTKYKYHGNEGNIEPLVCAYSYENLTSYTDNLSEWPSNTVSEVDADGNIHIDNVGLSKIKTTFYENLNYHIDNTYFLLKVLYPTNLHFIDRDNYWNLPKVSYIEPSSDNDKGNDKYLGIQLLDCTEEFDENNKVNPKNVIVRFADNRFIDYKVENIPYHYFEESKTYAFSPNYLYNYDLTGKEDYPIDKDAVKLFNSSTGTLTLNSKYLKNKDRIKITAQVAYDKNSYFYYNTYQIGQTKDENENSINNEPIIITQEYQFKKLLPMKFEVPDNTFTVYLNETIEDHKEYQNKFFPNRIVISGDNKTVPYLYASSYWNYDSYLNKETQENASPIYSYIIGWPSDWLNDSSNNEEESTNTSGDSSNDESSENLGFSKKEVNVNKNNRKVWIKLINNDSKLQSGLKFTLEGSLEFNNYEWIFIDTVKTNQNGVLEFDNVSNLFTKFRLISLNNYKFIENENSKEYIDYIICKDIIDKDNDFVKLSCEVFLDLEWKSFEFFKGYNTYLLKSDDANKLNIKDYNENYFTFDSLSQIQSITGLWDIYPYGLYTSQSTNVRSQSLGNSIKLIKDDCEVILKNTGYYKNNQLQDKDNLYYWVNSNNTARILQITKNDNIEVTDGVIASKFDGLLYLQTLLLKWNYGNYSELSLVDDIDNTIESRILDISINEEDNEETTTKGIVFGSGQGQYGTGSGIDTSKLGYPETSIEKSNANGYYQNTSKTHSWSDAFECDAAKNKIVGSINLVTSKADGLTPRVNKIWVSQGSSMFVSKDDFRFIEHSEPDGKSYTVYANNVLKNGDPTSPGREVFLDIVFGYNNDNVSTIKVCQKFDSDGAGNTGTSSGGYDSSVPDESIEGTSTGNVEIPDSAFKFSPESITVSSTGTLSNTPILINNYNLTNIKYRSSNYSVADVDPWSGEVRILDGGEANIIAKFAGDTTYAAKETSYKITANISGQGGNTPEDLPTYKFTFGYPTYRTTTIGVISDSNTYLINTENLPVVYSSSNSSVATIDSTTGIITTYSIGQTTITAIFNGNNQYNYKDATCTLIVESQNNPGGGDDPINPSTKTDLGNELSFSTNTALADTAGTLTTGPKLTNTYNLPLTFSSSDTSVATVNSNTGEVNVIGNGHTSISAIFNGNDQYNNKTIYYTLNVSISGGSGSGDQPANPDNPDNPSNPTGEFTVQSIYNSQNPLNYGGSHNTYIVIGQIKNVSEDLGNLQISSIAIQEETFGDATTSGTMISGVNDISANNNAQYNWLIKAKIQSNTSNLPKYIKVYFNFENDPNNTQYHIDVYQLKYTSSEGSDGNNQEEYNPQGTTIDKDPYSIDDPYDDEGNIRIPINYGKHTSNNSYFEDYEDEYGPIQIVDMPTLYLPENLDNNVYKHIKYTSGNPDVAELVYFKYNPLTGYEEPLTKYVSNESGEPIVNFDEAFENGYKLKLKLRILSIGESLITAEYPEADDIFEVTPPVSFNLVVKKKNIPTLELNENEFEIERKNTSIISDTTENPLNAFQIFKSPTPNIITEEDINARFKYVSSDNSIGEATEAMYNKHLKSPFKFDITKYHELSDNSGYNSNMTLEQYMYVKNSIEIGDILIFDIGKIKVTIKLRETEKYRSARINYGLSIIDPPKKTKTILQTPQATYTIRLDESQNKQVYRIFDNELDNEHKEISHFVGEYDSKKFNELLAAYPLNTGLFHHSDVGKNGHIHNYVIDRIDYITTFKDGKTLFKAPSGSWKDQDNHEYDSDKGKFNSLVNLIQAKAKYHSKDENNNNIPLFDSENIIYDLLKPKEDGSGYERGSAYVRLNCDVVYKPGSSTPSYYIFPKALEKRLKDDINKFYKNPVGPGYIDEHLSEEYPVYGEYFETYGCLISSGTKIQAIRLSTDFLDENYSSSDFYQGDGFLVKKPKNDLSLDDLMVRNNYDINDTRYQLFRTTFTSNNTDPEVEYTFRSNWPNIADVNAQGDVMVYLPGTVIITINSSETEHFTAGETCYQLIIEDRKNIRLDTKYNKYLYEMDTSLVENVFGCPELTWDNSDPDTTLSFWIRDGGPADNPQYLNDDEIRALFTLGYYELSQRPGEELNPSPSGGDDEDPSTIKYSLYLTDSENGSGSVDLGYIGTLEQLRPRSSIYLIYPDIFYQNDTNHRFEVDSTRFDIKYYLPDSNFDDRAEIYTFEQRNGLGTQVGTHFTGILTTDYFNLPAAGNRNLLSPLSKSQGVPYSVSSGVGQQSIQLFEYKDEQGYLDTNNVQISVDENRCIIKVMMSYSPVYGTDGNENVDYLGFFTSDISNSLGSSIAGKPSGILWRTPIEYGYHAYKDEKLTHDNLDPETHPEVTWLPCYSNKMINRWIQTNTDVYFGDTNDSHTGMLDWDVFSNLPNLAATTNLAIISCLTNSSYVYIYYDYPGEESEEELYLEENLYIEEEETVPITYNSTVLEMRLLVMNNTGNPINIAAGKVKFLLCEYDNSTRKYKIAEVIGTLSGGPTVLENNMGSPEEYKLTFQPTSDQNPNDYVLWQFCPKNLWGTYVSNVGIKISGEYYACNTDEDGISKDVVFYPNDFDGQILHIKISNILMNSGSVINPSTPNDLLYYVNSAYDPNRPIYRSDFKKELEITKQLIQVDDQGNQKGNPIENKYKVSIDEGGNLTIQNGLYDHVINVLVYSPETDNYQAQYHVYNVLIKNIDDANTVNGGNLSDDQSSSGTTTTTGTGNDTAQSINQKNINQVEMDDNLFIIRTNPNNLANGNEEIITFEAPKFRHTNTDPELQINYYIYDGGEIADNYNGTWYATTYRNEFRRPIWLRNPIKITDMINGYVSSSTYNNQYQYYMVTKGYDKYLKELKLAQRNPSGDPTGDLNINQTTGELIYDSSPVLVPDNITGNGTRYQSNTFTELSDLFNVATTETVNGCVFIDSYGNLKISSLLCNRVINVMIHFSSTEHFYENALFYNIKILPKYQTNISVDQDIFIEMLPDYQDTFQLPHVRTNNTDEDEIGYYLMAHLAGRVCHGENIFKIDDGYSSNGYQDNTDEYTFWENNNNEHYCDSLEGEISHYNIDIHTYNTEAKQWAVFKQENTLMNPNTYYPFQQNPKTSTYIVQINNSELKPIFILDKYGRIKYTSLSGRYVLNVLLTSKETTNFMEGSCFYNLEINIKPDPVLAIFPPVIKIIASNEEQTIKGPEITCTNNDPTHKLVFEIYDTEPIQTTSGTGGTAPTVSATPIIELDEVGNIKVPANIDWTSASSVNFDAIDDEGNFIYELSSYDLNTGELQPNATPKQIPINCITKWVKVISISTPNFARDESKFKVELYEKEPIDSIILRDPILKVNGVSGLNGTLSLTRTVVTGTEVFPRPIIEHINNDEGVEPIIISRDPSTINITPKGTLIVYKVGTALLIIKIPKSKHFEEASQELSVTITQQTIYE